MGITFDIVRDEAEFLSLQTDWNRLAQSVQFPSVFALHGFHAAWWEAFGGAWELRIVVGRDAGKSVRLIAPFMERRDRPGTWVTLSQGAADYETWLVAGSDTQAQNAFACWLALREPWVTIQMNHMADSPLLAGMPTVDRRSRGKTAWTLFTSFFPLAYRITDETHPYFTKESFERLSAKTRERDYRKHENWFSKRGPLEYRRLSTQAEIAPYLDTLFDLHIRKWTEKGMTSALAQPVHRKFLRALVAKLDPHGAVRVDLLLWRGNPVAAHLGFQWNGRLYWYITAYEPALGSHSPGKLLLANVIQRAEADGLQEVDFLRGEEGYKFSYATHVRKTFRMGFYRSRTALLRSWVLRRFDPSY